MKGITDPIRNKPVGLVHTFIAQLLQDNNGKFYLCRRQQVTIQKNLVSTLIMATAFLVTNIPYGYVAMIDNLKIDTDLRVKLYCTQSVFLSLLINPWLYPFRMETIRK